MNKQAFTLVELIVVITILAILGTIGFISLQGYTQKTRDSVRISDIGKIQKVLEVSYVKVGKYPNTSSGTNITFSGTTVWTQGIFGDYSFKQVERLNKIPKDPLLDIEYSYSVTNNNQEYQVAGIVEGNNISYNSSLGIKNTFANGNELTNIILKGNYNGKILTVSTGSLDYILALPSITSSSVQNPDLYNIIENHLVFNNYNNLPANYSNTQYKTIGSPELKLINSGSLVVFSGSIKDLNNKDNQVKFIKNLQLAYKNTSIVDTPDLKPLFIYDTVNNTEGTTYLAQIIIKENIDKNIQISSKNILYNPIASTCLNMSDIHINKLNSFFEGTLNYGDVTYWCNKTTLNAINKGLIGTLPPEIGNLEKLRSININRNLGITGTIPKEFGLLSNLEVLILYKLNLSGVIPNELSKLSKLKNLSIADNNISGGIPQWFSSTPSLGIISLGDNNLTGTIPLNIFGLENLTILSLYANKLSGPIPNEVGNLINLINLSLGWNNFTGPIPNELGNLTNLTSLILSSNNFTGPIPNKLGNLTNLTNLFLSSNNFTGTIPNELGNLTNLIKLTFNNNNLNGIIPIELSNLINLKTLTFNNNSFTDISTLNNLNTINPLSIRVDCSGFLPGKKASTVSTFYNSIGLFFCNWSLTDKSTATSIFE